MQATIERKPKIRTLTSYEVPQANDLQKIIAVVEAKARGEFVDDDFFKSTTRTVQYYLHAAALLGLLNADKTINSRGMEIMHMKPDHKLYSLYFAFLGSECGLAFDEWSKGKVHFFDLDGATARRFLKDVSIGLKEATINRRAASLLIWAATFRTAIRG